MNPPLDSAPSNQELEWTGERFVTSVKGSIYYEHVHRYAFASELCQGKACLDIASGEGFGSNLLATKASRVWGVDIDQKSVAHAQQKYRRENLTFLNGSATSIPLEDKSVDVVTSFETIEHFTEHDKFMQEILRVLKVGGLLVISSPEKAEYTDKPAYANPYHLAELYHHEFHKLLQNYFSHVLMGKQRLVVGSCIAPDRQDEATPTRFGVFSGGVSATQFTEGVPAGLYSMAICSNEKIPEIKYGLFEDHGVLTGEQAINTYVYRFDPLLDEVAYLKRVVESAHRWQRRSWMKRAFHRWRAPKR